MPIWSGGVQAARSITNEMSPRARRGPGGRAISSDVTLIEEGGDYRLAPLTRRQRGAAPRPAGSPISARTARAVGRECSRRTSCPRRANGSRASACDLSTMVLLGMQRVIIKDGTIGARLRFRARRPTGRRWQYATSNDPGTGGTTWADAPAKARSTKVSRSTSTPVPDSELKAELFATEDQFRFETLPPRPLRRRGAADLLERHSRAPARAGAVARRRQPPPRRPRRPGRRASRLCAAPPAAAPPPLPCHRRPPPEPA